jgi:signal transduction histidine kinase
VEDTGSGIADDILERMGDPFFNTKTREKGNGRGMAVVHRVVESDLGRMRIALESGRSTPV